MVSSGRHPKAPIAKALAAVRRPDLDVEGVHRGHRWGVLICRVCGNTLAIYSTPKVPEDTARAVYRFDAAHRHDDG